MNLLDNYHNFSMKTVCISKSGSAGKVRFFVVVCVVVRFRILHRSFVCWSVVLGWKHNLEPVQYWTSNRDCSFLISTNLLSELVKKWIGLQVYVWSVHILGDNFCRFFVWKCINLVKLKIGKQRASTNTRSSCFNELYLTARLGWFWKLIYLQYNRKAPGICCLL